MCHHYTSHDPFGRKISLILNDANEVVDSVSGDDRKERAEQIAKDHDEIFPPPELGECGA